MGSLELLKLLKKFGLLLAEFHRGLNVNLHIHIASHATAVDVGEPLSFDREDFARLGPFRDGNAVGAIEGSGDLFLTAESGFREGDGEVNDDIVTVAIEDIVGFDIDVDVKIAWGGSFAAGIAVACHLKPHAAVDASWDRNFNLLFLFEFAGAVTLGTGVGDHLARAVAVGAGSCHAKEAAVLLNLSVATTGVAGLDIGSQFGARTGAGFT